MNEEKKPKNPDAPCKGCESRCAGCHSKCPDYAEYKARLSWLRSDPHSIEDAYLMLAGHIVSSEIKRYKRALRKYAHGGITQEEVQQIEDEICTPYYATLTLYSMDLSALCRSMREEAGLPELEESE